MGNPTGLADGRRPHGGRDAAQAVQPVQERAGELHRSRSTTRARWPRSGSRFEQLAGKGIFTGPVHVREARPRAASPTSGTRGTGAAPQPLAGLRGAQGDRRAGGHAGGGQRRGRHAAGARGQGQAPGEAVPGPRVRRGGPGGRATRRSTCNPAKEPFTDQEVRKAFALAVDNEAISRAVMDGVWRPLQGDVPGRVRRGRRVEAPTSPGQREGLLDEAGWVHGGGRRPHEGRAGACRSRS